MPSALPPNQQQGNLTNTSVQQTPQQSQAQVPPPTDFLGKIGTAGPPWAHGIAIIITAFVTLFSVLKIDFGQIISNYISDSNTVTAQTVQNNKTVIGVGVKNSTSDLFIGNCDDFMDSATDR